MKKTGQDILVDSFENRFHSKAASMVKKGLADKKISNFLELEPKEQVEVAQALIDATFKELFDSNVIQGIKARFVLRFAINNAIDMMQTMMQKNVNLELKPLVEESLSKTKKIGNQISQKDTTKFCFECSGLLSGILVVAIETDDAVVFSKQLMQYMMGTKAENNEMDAEKMSTIYEFFNVLFPEVLEIVGEAFDNSIFFTPLYFEDFQTKFFENEDLKEPKGIQSSSMIIEIEKEKTIGKIFFLLQ